MHLMALGMFIFDLGSLPFDELQRKADWQHARAPRVGARDAAQFIGPGAETITISGATYAELADGRVSLDELREMAAAGDAVPLVSGAGEVFGTYVIEAIDERHAYLMEDGRPRRIDFAIDLLRVDDPAQEDQAGAAQ